MILNQVEQEMKDIQAKSVETLFATFMQTPDGWILKSDYERYQALQSVLDAAKEFDNTYGSLISDYRDAYGKDEGFEEFLEKMSKINPDHEKAISAFFYLQSQLKELDVNVEAEVKAENREHEIIVPDVPVSPIKTEEELVGEPERAQGPVKVRPKRAMKIKSSRPLNISVRVAQPKVEEEVISVGIPEVAVEEKKVEEVEPIVVAMENPIVEDKKEPEIIESPKTADEESIVEVIEAKEMESHEVEEPEIPVINPEEFEEELEVDEVEDLKKQITDKKEEKKEIKAELKDLRKKKRQAVIKRRKYNWGLAKDKAVDYVSKKAVMVKGIGVLETSINKGNDYRKSYLEVEKFYLAYPNRSFEENKAELERLSQSIGGSELLTIKEKMRLYRKVQRLSRKVDKLNKKNMKNSGPVQEEASEELTALIDNGQSILDSFGDDSVGLHR